jgi:hypothetical protein
MNIGYCWGSRRGRAGQDVFSYSGVTSRNSHLAFSSGPFAACLRGLFAGCGGSSIHPAEGLTQGLRPLLLGILAGGWHGW